MKLFLVLGLLFTSLSQASTKYLTEDMILESTKLYFPKILEEAFKVEAKIQKARSARGIFDSKLVARRDQRTSGPYEDAEANEVALERRFSPLGLKVSTGYRLSDQEFPKYEEFNSTLDDGEWNFKVAFNLLRNRAMDEFRFDVENARIDQEQAQQNQRQIQVDIQAEAALIYWNWFLMGNTLKVYKTQLELAMNRQKALIARQKAGSYPKIGVLENEQIILMRKAEYQKALQKFDVAALAVSLFWRNTEGNMIAPAIENLMPLADPEKLLDYPIKEKDRIRILQLQPELEKLKNELVRNSLQSEQAENLILPELKVDYKYSEDTGENRFVDSRLQGAEHRIMLNVEIPIEQRKGRGSLSSLDAEKNALKNRQRLYQEKTLMKIDQIFIKLKALKEITMNHYQAFELAKKVEDAENKRFLNGGSDLFVLNAREMNTAKANIEWLESLWQYKQSLIEYRKLIFDF